MMLWSVNLKMPNDKVLNMLGLARRAGKLSLGHDASEASVKDFSASLCLVSSDASQRLKDEMINLCEQNRLKTRFCQTQYSMNELGMCLGAKTTAVLVE